MVKAGRAHVRGGNPVYNFEMHTALFSTAFQPENKIAARTSQLVNYYYRDRNAKEIDVVLEGDGKRYPLDIKKTTMPDKCLIRTFKVIDKSPLELGTGAILCMADRLGAFDKDNLIVPIWMI